MSRLFIDTNYRYEHGNTRQICLENFNEESWLDLFDRENFNSLGLNFGKTLRSLTTAAQFVPYLMDGEFLIRRDFF